jgi:hypothetical protein
MTMGLCPRLDSESTARARRSVVDHPPGTGKARGSNPRESTHFVRSLLRFQQHLTGAEPAEPAGYPSLVRTSDISDPNRSPEQLLFAELRRDLSLARAYLERAVGLD